MNETTLKIFNRTLHIKKAMENYISLPHGLVECWLMPIVFSTFCHPGILCITLPEPVLLTLPEDVFLNFSVKSLPNMICPG